MKHNIRGVSRGNFIITIGTLHEGVLQANPRMETSEAPEDTSDVELGRVQPLSADPAVPLVLSLERTNVEQAVLRLSQQAEAQGRRAQARYSGLRVDHVLTSTDLEAVGGRQGFLAIFTLVYTRLLADPRPGQGTV